MKLRYLGVLAAVMLLAACQSTSGTAESTKAEEATAASTMTRNELTQAADDLQKNVGDRVFFGFDRYDLTNEARSTLSRQVEWMRRYPNMTVTVEGHADERGTRDYNLALGERRANAVKNYMTAMGVSSTRVGTVSYGKERPAVMGSDEAAWAQNRRGVTVVNR